MSWGVLCCECPRAGRMPAPEKAGTQVRRRGGLTRRAKRRDNEAAQQQMCTDLYPHPYPPPPPPHPPTHTSGSGTRMHAPPLATSVPPSADTCETRGWLAV